MVKTLIKSYRDPTQLDFGEIWEQGLFIFDTNVLLDLYRLPSTARDDLIKVLEHEQFKNRIWVGFQVFLEFFNNKYSVISDQKNKFDKVIKLLDSATDEYQSLFSSLTNEIKKELNSRHSLINPEKLFTSLEIEEIQKSRELNLITSFRNELVELKEKQLDVNHPDTIKDSVIRIFSEKVGDELTENELNNIYKEGEERYKNKLPPGYKDEKSKTDKNGEEKAFFFNGRKYINKFGDLILWKEIIKKAKEGNYKHIVFVTGDVKSDWFLRERNKRIGARKELLNEIYLEAPELETFYIYDTSLFLQYAKIKLHLDIQDSSIRETKELIEADNETDTYCILNTNSKNSEEDDEKMLSEHIAAAYFDPWKYKIEKLTKNSVVFLYRNGEGIVAMGKSDGNVKIRDYHADPSYKDEEFYVNLYDFCNLECNPITASEVKEITTTNHRFLSTLFCIDKTEGRLLYQEAKKRACKEST